MPVDDTEPPFRPPEVSPDWRSADVVALASTIHRERNFDLLPFLADALEEAGCDDPRILEHCRSAVGHDQGCWVIDCLLGSP